VSLDTDEGREIIRRIAQRYEATCLIFDNRDSAFPLTPELDGSLVRAAMLATKALAQELDVAMLLVSHEPKAEYAESSSKLRGHTAWAAHSDQLFQLRRKGDLRVLVHAKHRGLDQRPTIEVKLLFHGDTDLGSLQLVGSYNDAREARSKARLEGDVSLLEAYLGSHGRSTFSVLKDETKWGNDRLYRALGASDRIWQPEGKGRPYSVEPLAEGEKSDQHGLPGSRFPVL
jgi:hypothetical protein